MLRWKAQCVFIFGRKLDLSNKEFVLIYWLLFLGFSFVLKIFICFRITESQNLSSADHRSWIVFVDLAINIASWIVGTVLQIVLIWFIKCQSNKSERYFNVWCCWDIVVCLISYMGHYDSGHYIDKLLSLYQRLMNAHWLPDYNNITYVHSSYKNYLLELCCIMNRLRYEPFGWWTLDSNREHIIEFCKGIRYIIDNNHHYYDYYWHEHGWIASICS